MSRTVSRWPLAKMRRTAACRQITILTSILETARLRHVPLVDMPMTISAGSMVAYSYSNLVDATAATGCTAISVTKRLRHVAATRENLSVADMLGMLKDRGLHVAECEGTPHWLSDPAGPDPRVFGLDEIIDLSVALEARGFVVYHDDRPGGSIETFTRDFAAVCDRAAEHDLAVAIEFLPWSRIPTFANAVTIVQGAGQRTDCLRHLAPQPRPEPRASHHARAGSAAALHPGRRRPPAGIRQHCRRNHDGPCYSGHGHA